MDYKRNKRFFDPGFERKLTAIALCGAFLTVLFLALWWYIWISSIVSTLFTIGAFIGIGIVIGAVSIRPKVNDINEQIDIARQAFIDATAEKLKFPNDFEENSISVWGFTDGSIEKTLQNGHKYTDHVMFASLYLKRNQLYIRTEVCSLIEDDRTLNEYALSLAGMTLSADESTHTLTITANEETLTLAIQSIDYLLEEYITKVERQIKKII